MTKDFDKLFSSLPSEFVRAFLDVGGQPNRYPPYNIIALDDNKTALELAIAGFNEKEITVSVYENKLTITGAKQTFNDNNKYIHKGIGTRQFERVFDLSTDTEVIEASQSDGILSIILQTKVPETKKPTTIPIGKGTRQYLAEENDIVSE